MAEALEAAARVRRRHIPQWSWTPRKARLGLAAELAAAVGARLLPITDLSADVLGT